MVSMLKNKLLLVALGALFCAVASAGVIGSFDVNGGAGGNVAVGLTTIDWYPLGTGTGALVVVSGGTGIFPVLHRCGDDSRSEFRRPAGRHAVQPAAFPRGQRCPYPAWSWTATDYLSRYLFLSAACGLASRVGQTCTPFPLRRLTLSTLRVGDRRQDFRCRERPRTESAGRTASTPNLRRSSAADYQSYLPGILAGTPAVSSWSGSITVNDNVPEPATFFLISAGLIGVGLIRRVVR